MCVSGKVLAAGHWTGSFATSALLQMRPPRPDELTALTNSGRRQARSGTDAMKTTQWSKELGEQWRQEGRRCSKFGQLPVRVAV